MSFSNGTGIYTFISRFCEKGCVNYTYDAASETWGCIITDLQLEFGYGAKGDVAEILKRLCKGDFCSMYKRLQEGGIEPLKRAKGQVMLHE